MPSYKLIYFDRTGRAEPIRWILSYMNMEFEDCRFAAEKWLELKEGILFGKVPVLDIDDKRLYQSEAICRYLGRQAKLGGSNDFEDQQIDAIVGTIGGLRAVFRLAAVEADPERKTQLLDKLKQETVLYYMKIYNDIAKTGYLANGKLSWADIYFAAMEDSMETFLGEPILDDFPNLKTLKQKILSFPGIKKWLEQSPKI